MEKHMKGERKVSKSYEEYPAREIEFIVFKDKHGRERVRLRGANMSKWKIIYHERGMILKKEKGKELVELWRMVRDRVDIWKRLIEDKREKLEFREIKKDKYYVYGEVSKLRGEEMKITNFPIRVRLLNDLLIFEGFLERFRGKFEFSEEDWCVNVNFCGKCASLSSIPVEYAKNSGFWRLFQRELESGYVIEGTFRGGRICSWRVTYSKNS